MDIDFKSLPTLLFALTLFSSSVVQSKIKGYTLTSNGNRTLVFDHQPLTVASQRIGTSVILDPDPIDAGQEMDGFGAAITGSTCYNLMKMNPVDRKAFLIKTFSPKKGLGFSYARISIGCSDFSLSEFTCCDKPGIENFALTDEDLNYVLPILREVRKINPDIKFIGSPWTCPPWMKVKDLVNLEPFESWTSGQLNPKYYADYADYFVRWVKAYEAAGAPIYSITVQNEPLNRGNSASLFMGWDEQQKFVAEYLGPAFEKADLKTKIYAFDHNYNYDNLPEQQQYPLRIYDLEKAASYLSGAAYHNYGGRRSELKKVAEARPDKELIFTETSIGMWNDGRNLSKRLVEDMREVALGTVNNGCRAVLVWNLMLDSERGPYRPGGCSTCYGAVDIDRNDWKTITYNSHYYIIGHLSSVVKPGAVRINAMCTDSEQNLMLSAFTNPDGSRAVVMLNQQENDQTVSISINGTDDVVQVIVPARGVTSALIKGL